MKKRVFGVCCALISLLQIALAAGLVWFNQLAYRRGGVNHHVAFRKRQYNQTVFTEDNVLVMKIVLAVLIAALAALLIWLLWKRAAKGGAAICGLSILWAGVLVWELSAETFKAIRIYPYAVLGTAVGLALELLLLLLWRAARTGQRHN